MKKYTTIQIDTATHSLLKEYCNAMGYSISGFVQRLIKEKIDKSNLSKKPDPSKILKVK